MVQISRLIRKKLGDLLLEESVLKEEQLREVQLRIRATGEGFVDCLHMMGFVTETESARAVAKQLGLPFIDPTKYRIPKEAMEAVALPFLRLNNMAVLDKIGRTLIVAVAGGLNAEALERVERATGCQVFIYVAVLSKVAAVLDKMVPAAGKK